MYCYIKNSELIATSDTLITQKTDTEDGMAYDEVIKTKLTGRVEYIGGKIVQYTEPAPPPETPEAKHKRVYQNIVTGDLSIVNLEGEVFSDIEIGDMITDKVFGGNPHAEKALTNKMLAISIALLSGESMTQEMLEKIAYAKQKKAEVDAVRNLFNLGNL